MQKKKSPRPSDKPRASTLDIVGNQAPPEAAVPHKWKKHYHHLLEVRDQLLQRQSTLSSDAEQETSSFSTHMADAATDTYDRDLALGMLSSEQNALYQIDQALDRIRNGTYGTCELTGKPIEQARLDAVPWARFSLKAEKELEDQGARKRTGLGPREAVTRSTGTEEADAEDS
jgi:RNA polymerase-binding protein DksA